MEHHTSLWGVNSDVLSTIDNSILFLMSIEFLNNSRITQWTILSLGVWGEMKPTMQRMLNIVDRYNGTSY